MNLILGLDFDRSEKCIGFMIMCVIFFCMCTYKILVEDVFRFSRLKEFFCSKLDKDCTFWEVIFRNFLSLQNSKRKTVKKQRKNIGQFTDFDYVLF